MTTPAEIISPSGRVRLAIAPFDDGDATAAMAELAIVSAQGLATSSPLVGLHPARHNNAVETLVEASTASFLLMLKPGEPFPNGHVHVQISTRTLGMISTREVIDALELTLTHLKGQAA